MRSGLLLLVAALSVCQGAHARDEYSHIARLRAMNQRMAGIRPMADGEHYTVLEENRIVRYKYVEASAGENLLPAAVAELPIDDYLFSPDERHILIASGRKPIYRHSYTSDYWLVRVGRGGIDDANGAGRSDGVDITGSTDDAGDADGSGATCTRVLDRASAPRDASFSPDSRLVAYSDHNDLYVYDLATRQTRRITDDGAWNATINGTTDWVYEEELAFTKAYAFSPDSRRIAYMRFDEREVPLMQMMRYDAALYNEAWSFKYPKAGGRNSIVSVWVCDLTTGHRERIDTGPEQDQYITRIGWTPDGQLYFFRLDRRQKHFEVVLCETTGTQRTIYEERSQQYIERVDAKSVQFIDNDRFLVRQETRAGYMHLYLHSIRHGLLAQLTHGAWEVTEVVGCADEHVWYLSTETSPLRRNLYSIRLNGTQKRRLTPDEGFYTIAPSAGMKYYISTFSNASTPNRVEVCTGEGVRVRVPVESRELREALAAEKRPVKEFFNFTTERGDTLAAYMLKPRDFDPVKRYPVLLTQYSGPGSQSVQDRWTLDWEDALVDKGYVVVCADVRGTGFRGEKFKKLTYARLGELEVEDQLSFARHMAALPWVDAGRIGIYGWSYGGFMALGCALKGHGLFRMAIAVAPVSSWRFYDTIYTEVYNDLPQYNATGYDDNSPINFAHMLDDAHTRLLIVHGTADDNVHFQNTIEMARALNRHGKQYDMMIYPDQNHSMLPDDTNNVRQKMIEYTLKNL